MISKKIKAVSFVATIGLFSGVAYADQESQIQRLGDDLTPLGAEKSGSEDGRIPEWTGGLSADAAAVNNGFMSNPFPDDEPLFTITASNYQEYEENLSEGQVAMLENYPETYKIPVYETRRSAAVPDHIAEAAKNSVRYVKTVNDGNGLAGFAKSRYYARPFPEKGVDVIWNHLTRYKGGSSHRVMAQVSPYANGAYSLVLFDELYAFPETVEGATDEHMDSVLFFFRQEVLRPARLSGSILVAHETIDQVKERRRVWIYNSGQRRVRRAPQVAYDGPGQSADGQRVADNLDMFLGAPDKYNWELVGKKKVYIPYNSYKLASPDLKYDDIFKVGHIDQSHTRYELHRVWVVEATVKEGERHVYAKRTFYVDEDTWQIGLQDMYDGKGDLWRVAEGHTMQYYNNKVPGYAGEAIYDLLNGRYLAMGFSNEEDRGTKFGVKSQLRDFSPSALRQSGR